MDRYGWVIKQIKSDWGTIFLSMFLFSLVMVLIAKFFVKNIYESDATFIVTSSNIEEFIKAEDVNYNAAITKTYEDVISSPAFLKSVKEKEKLPYSLNDLNNAVEVDIKANSSIFTIKSIASSPNTARKIGQAVANQLGDFLIKIFDYDRPPIYQLSKNNLPELPLVPNIWRALGMGMILGYLSGVTLVLYRKWQAFDYDLKYLFDLRGIAKLGEIPTMIQKRKQVHTQRKHKI